VVGAIVYKALSIWLVSQTDLSKLVLGGVIVLIVVAFSQGHCRDAGDDQESPSATIAQIRPRHRDRERRMSIAHTLLSVEALSKSYGGVHAVRDVSFALQAGEILALIGPNGAGKSTCFDMLNGQNIPDSGRINLLGQDTAGRKPREIWRLGVGRTFQITATFPTMTVARERSGRAGVARSASCSISGLRRRIRARGGRPFAGPRRHERLRVRRPCGELAYGDLKRLELADRARQSAKTAAE